MKLASNLLAGVSKGLKWFFTDLRHSLGVLLVLSIGWNLMLRNKLLKAEAIPAKTETEAVETTKAEERIVVKTVYRDGPIQYVERTEEKKPETVKTNKSVILAQKKERRFFAGAGYGRDRRLLALGGFQWSRIGAVGGLNQHEAFAGLFIRF